MKWFRLYKESEDENQTIPIEVSMRELKLIQNYLTKQKPLNDPSNKECLDTVIRILNDLVNNSKVESLDTYVANYFFENFGIEVDVDPYGENSAIELGENGLIPLSNCKHPELTQDGVFADLVQGGFWNEVTGNLEEGYISVEDLNEVIKSDGDDIGNGIREVQLKQDGKVARLLLTFK